MVRVFIGLMGLGLLASVAWAQETQDAETAPAPQQEQSPPQTQKDDGTDPYEAFEADQEISYDVPVSFPADI